MAIKRSSYTTLPIIQLVLLILVSFALLIYGWIRQDMAFTISVIIPFSALISMNIFQVLNEKHTISSLHFEAINFLKKQLQILDLLEKLDINCEMLDESVIQKIDAIYGKRYDFITSDRKIIEEMKTISIGEKTDISKLNENIEKLLKRREKIEKEYEILMIDIQKEMNLP